jgi:hypothetical protein
VWVGLGGELAVRTGVGPGLAGVLRSCGVVPYARVSCVGVAGNVVRAWSPCGCFLGTFTPCPILLTL